MVCMAGGVVGGEGKATWLGFPAADCRLDADGGNDAFGFSFAGGATQAGPAARFAARAASMRYRIAVIMVSEGFCGGV